jgi:hypothetical protein
MTVEEVRRCCRGQRCFFPPPLVASAARSLSLVHRNKTERSSRRISRFSASTRRAAWSRRMRRVGMTGLLERRVAAAAIFAETRLRFQRPSARQSLATCAAAAVAPRRPRAHSGHQSRREQAQSGGCPIVCAPSSSTAPTAAADRGQVAWEGRYHTRKHAHAVQRIPGRAQMMACRAPSGCHPWLQNTRPRRVAKGWFRRNCISENYRFTSVVHLQYTDSVPGDLRRGHAHHPPACMPPLPIEGAFCL